MIDIVVLTKDRPEFFRQFVTALYSRTSVPFHLILVDNNSGREFHDRMECLLSGLPKKYKTTIVKLGRNIGHRAWVQGLSKVESNPFVITDPDCVVPKLEPCWLTQMLALMKKYPEIGQLGCELDPINCHAVDPQIHAAGRCGHGRHTVYGIGGEIHIQPVDTTTSLVRHGHPGNFGKVGSGIKGLVGVAANIQAYHLGWDEHMYPELRPYIIEKIKTFPHLRRAYEKVLLRMDQLDKEKSQ